MAVSAVGTNLTFNMVRRLAVAVVVIFCVLAYLYGPAATPAMRDAAVGELVVRRPRDDRRQTRRRRSDPARRP